jgi:Tfp pilus assembly protein PilN
MMPVETKPFKKISIQLTVVSITTAVLLAGYIYFFNILDETRQNVASLTNEISLLESDEAESNQIKNQLSDTDESHKVLTSYFVDVNNPVPFEEMLEEYGRKTNVKVVFQSLDIAKNPNRLNVSFVADGSFSDTYKFLSLVESAPFELSINSIGLQSLGPIFSNPIEKNKKTNIPWNTQITLSVYSVSGIK